MIIYYSNRLINLLKFSLKESLRFIRKEFSNRDNHLINLLRIKGRIRWIRFWDFWLKWLEKNINCTTKEIPTCLRYKDHPIITYRQVPKNQTKTLEDLLLIILWNKSLLKTQFKSIRSILS
jgi:hypothetical protein